jgi:3-methyladenine DNA glycosylase/8-oxoguanine DNA glycosylase
VTDPILLPLRGPSGEPVDLWRTLISHGFAELPPMALDEDRRTLTLTVRPPRGAPRRVVIGRGPRGRAAVRLDGGPAPSAATRTAIAEAVARVLRLDQDLAPFYEVAAGDERLAWVTAGAGRMLRSQTVWEDVVKTICTTNCTWALTRVMVRALVSELGDPAAGHRGDPLANAFPTPAAMAAHDEAFYREVVRSGYRAPRFVELATMAAEGRVDLEALGSASRDELPDEEVERQLLALPGVGPYAAAHIMMTLGRNSKPVLDSWTRPTYARLTGRRRPPADAAIARRFRAYGPEAGLAFWLFVTRDWVDDGAPPEGLPVP